MKKLLVAGLVALAMAMSFGLRPEQGAITDTKLPVEYLLADDNSDTSSG